VPGRHREALSAVEEGWSRFITDGPVAVAGRRGGDGAHERQFELEDGDTLASLLAHYDTTAAATDALVAEVDLDGSQPLPEAPWFPRAHAGRRAGSSCT